MIRTCLLIGAILGLAGCGDSSDSAEDIKWKLRFAATDAVKSRLKDPESARFGEIDVINNIACGSLNGKNSFGGYSGNQRFISAGFVENTFLETDMDKADFDYVWSVKCQ